MKKKHIKYIIIGILFLFVVLLLLINIFGVKVMIDLNGNKQIQKNVTHESLLQEIPERYISFVENDTKKSRFLSELGISYDFDEETKSYIDKHIFISYHDLNLVYNLENLQFELDKFNEDRTKNQYASLEKDENGFYVSEEIQGNYLDTKKLYDDIKEFLELNTNVNNTSLSINLKDYYEPFDTSNISQTELEKELEKIENTYISYTNGYQLNLMDLQNYLIIKDNQIIVDPDKKTSYEKSIDKLLETNLKEYDTIGSARNFTTANGNMITVSGGTYGNIFSSDKETQYISSLFDEFGHEENRIPIYTKEMPSDIGTTYIEVSISQQHVWYFKNGELIMDTDTVTGTQGKHDTPKGTYFISERINGKYLRGADYKTWVNKWMRLTNSGVGLHDAYWRKSFGGSIYKTSGSHGCINLPKSFAYKLYDETYVNMPVIIY